jgi:D-glycero-alpha-D-manno-heptose-7-phosphate kinase
MRPYRGFGGRTADGRPPSAVRGLPFAIRLQLRRIGPVSSLRIIHARAPIRICDNGGWTDTWFAGHGSIFNIAVSPCAEVHLTAFPRAEREHRIVVHAANYGETFVYDDSWSHHPLLEAAISSIPLPEAYAVHIDLHCDAPAGASTGTSAAVTVALLAALDMLRGRSLTAHELAYAAQRVETVLLKRQCGIQDQLAAAYGGVNFIDMYAYPHASVSSLDLSRTMLRELERRMALIFLGRTHDSSQVHEQVIRELEDAGPDDLRIEALRRTAPRSRDALFAGDFVALGRAMIDNTAAQANLNAALVGSDAHCIIEIARAHGALGWKVNGAGGEGGSVSILCGADPAESRELLRQIAAAGPYRHLPTTLCAHGAIAWECGAAQGAR